MHVPETIRVHRLNHSATMPFYTLNLNVWNWCYTKKTWTEFLRFLSGWWTSRLVNIVKNWHEKYFHSKKKFLIHFEKRLYHGSRDDFSLIEEVWSYRALALVSDWCRMFSNNYIKCKPQVRSLAQLILLLVGLWKMDRHEFDSVFQVYTYDIA